MFVSAITGQPITDQEWQALSLDRQQAEWTAYNTRQQVLATQAASQRLTNTLLWLFLWGPLCVLTLVLAVLVITSGI